MPKKVVLVGKLCLFLALVMDGYGCLWVVIDGYRWLGVVMGGYGLLWVVIGGYGWLYGWFQMVSDCFRLF